LRARQTVQQPLLRIERFLCSFKGLARSLKRLPLFVELFLLCRNLFPQLSNIVRPGGTLRPAQYGEQQCKWQ